MTKPTIRVSNQVRHKPACTEPCKLEISYLKRNSSIPVAQTKALISFAFTTKLICAFVFAYTDSWFSDAVAQLFLAFVDSC